MNHNGKSRAMPALVAVIALGSSVSAQAQAAWNVNDREAQRILGQIRTNTDDIRRYYEEHGQRGRPAVKLFSAVEWPEGQALPKVAEDHGVAMACGNEPVLTAAAIRTRLSRGFSLPAKATLEQIDLMQKEICAARHFVTNLQYNESVKLVSETLPAIKEKYEQDVLEGINSHGGRGFDDAGAHQVTLMAAQLEFEMAVVQFRERQAQYDRYQVLLGQYSNYVGRQALAGRGKDGDGIVDSLISATVGGSIIQAALKLGN